MVCDQVDLPTVQDVLRSSSVRSITKLQLNLPSDEEEQTVPADVSGGKRMEMIEITCPATSLAIHSEAFRASRSATKVLEIGGCDLSHLDYSFLADFASLQSLVFRKCVAIAANFQALDQLTQLAIEDSPDLQHLSKEFLSLLPNLTSLSIDNCRNFDTFANGSLPNMLKSLSISHCPEFKQWNIFHQLTELKEVRLIGSPLDDQSVSDLLDAILSSPVAETLTNLNLNYNLMTRIPHQLSHLPKLSDLHLDYNNIFLLNSGSLHLKAPKVNAISLIGNGLRTIESGAFAGRPRLKCK